MSLVFVQTDTWQTCVVRRYRTSVFMQTDTCQRCVRQPVGDSVGIRVGNLSVNVAKARNFFASLCEILTGYIPSVLESKTPLAIRWKSVGECGKIP